jgi:hypothetical protein
MRRDLITFLLLLSAGQFVRAEPLTVVGFNVESGDSSDHVISLQLEKSVGVDIWGLVDVWDKRGWPERLRAGAAEGEGSDFGAVLGKTGRDSRLLTLFRRSRLLALEQQEISAAQASPREPAPLAVRFHLKGVQEFWFLTVDLSDQEDRRLRQARALAEWASEQSVPLVAVGTFNFGLEPDSDRLDEGLEVLLSSGWRLARPIEHIGTRCGGGDRMEDFVFLAGPSAAWSDRAEVMYPQSNYCPDSGRTSNHRPVLANLETTGSTPVITGSMPERQIRPFFPEEIEPRQRNEPVLANPTVAKPQSADEQAYPRGSEGSGGESTDPSREDLLRRIEALEAEARELRKELENQPD